MDNAQKITPKLIIISAYNITTGGGKVLLENLIDDISEQYEVICFLKKRIPVSFTRKNVTVIQSSSFISKLSTELKISFLTKNNPAALLLCFGNLPPLFFSKCETRVFCQNRYFFEKNCPLQNGFKLFIKMIILKLWFKLRSSKDYLYITQTPTMKNLLAKFLGGKFKIKIMPIAKKLNITASAEKPKDFCYIASGEPHKNHLKLVQSWIYLKDEFNVQPKLTLVLNSKMHSDLYSKLDKIINQNKLNIEIIDSLLRDEILNLISKTSTIYPSLFESYGLPLVEAYMIGVPILASEKDYVRDVCNPVQTFDPESEISIARAVVRYLDNDLKQHQPKSASDLIVN